MNLRIDNHPVLGKAVLGEKVKILVDGDEIEAHFGEPVAVALLAAGKRTLRKTGKTNEPRGIFCAIGLCTDCVMTVNGVANVRTCITPVEEKMIIQSQTGAGQWKDDGSYEE